ncbi:ATP-binding protein [Streptomyces sp. NPDC056716]|uniref:ATP-binding protein n=1 Tax=unclassified Streptomyces TaxID=2593676 RepID=UPI003680AE75
MSTTPPTPTSPTSYRLTTANARTAPGVLRNLVATLLRSTGHDALAESARLCTSEVVTNVYRHTRTPLIHMEVAVSEASVTVWVHDDLPGVLPLQPVGRDGESGHGLHLVEACADQWGSAVRGGLKAVSKAVFFTLDEGGRGTL